MPDGEHLGDGYIEVNFDVDQASAARAEAASKAMQDRIAANMDRNIDKTTDRQVSAMKSLDAQKEKAEAASSVRSARNLADREKAEADAGARSARNLANALQAKEKAETESEKRISDMETEAHKATNVDRESSFAESVERSKRVMESFERARVTAGEATARLRNSNEEMLESEKNRILDMTESEAAKLRDSKLTDIFDRGNKVRNQHLQDALSFLPGTMERALVGALTSPTGLLAITAAATVLGSALTSGVLAAVGLADLGGGIALAIMSSPRLKELGGQLGHDLFNALKDASAGLERPVQDALERLDAAIPMLVAPIKNSFDSLAPAIPALTDGLIAFGLQMSSMFADVSRNLMPVLLVFANELLPQLGATLRNFFEELSKDQGATILGLRLLIGTIDVLISALGNTLRAFQLISVGGVYMLKFLLDGIAFVLDGLAASIPNVGGLFNKIVLPIQHAADGLRHAGDGVTSVTQAQGMGTQVMNEYANATTSSAEKTAAHAANTLYQAKATAVLDDALRISTDVLHTNTSAELELANQVQNAVNQIDKQFDAVHKNIDADQDWNKKLLDLTDALAKNGATLDIHTRSGLANRDSLEAAAGASRKLWEEDVASGVPVTEATRRANERTKALLDQFGQTGELRNMTQELIDKYGAIPGDVKTVLTLQGYDTTTARLQDLRVQQLSLQQGIPVSQAMQTVRDEGKGLNRADGGPIYGPGGPREDKIPAMLSNGEYVINAAQTAKHYGLVKAINDDMLGPALMPNKNVFPGFAQGGMVQNPVSQDWQFKIDVAKTLIPQILFSGGLGSSSGQSVDVIGAIAQIFQADAHVTSGYRPGEMLANGPSWHASGEAADLVSGNMDGLAQSFYDRLSNGILEEIHANGRRHWGIKNGVRPYEMGDTLWGQHNDHVHIAMHRDAALAALDWLKHGGAGVFAGGLGGGGAGGGAAGNIQQFALGQLSKFGWGADQFGPLKALWDQESGWNPNAVNPSSGAYGIPQSLGHGHPYNLGDYPAQILWGLNYIKGTYGSPAGAWAHEQSNNWYDSGGYLPPLNGTGVPEPVLTAEQWQDISTLAARGSSQQDIHVYVHDGQVKELISCELKDHDDRLVDSLFRGAGG